MGWLFLFARLAEGGTGGCASPLSGEALSDALTRAEAAYAALRLDDFEREIQALRSSIPCLDRVVAPAEVARLHRLAGLDDFVHHDDGRARGAFAAAIELDSRPLSVELVPEGAAEHTLYAEARALPPPTVLIAPPPDGRLWIDGEETRGRAVERPALVQYVDRGGAVASTWWLGAGEALPDYPELGERLTPGQWAAGSVGAALVAGGAGLLIAGVATEAGDTYQALKHADAATERAEARAWYFDHIAWRYTAGGWMLGAGAATLAGTGVWAVIVDGGAVVGVRGRW